MNNKMLRRTRNTKQGNNLPTKKEKNDEFSFNFTQTYSSSPFNYYSYGYMLSENEDEKMLDNLLKLFAVCIERSNETKNDAERNNQAMNTYLGISLSYGTNGYNTCTQNERNNSNVEQFLINLVNINGKYFTEEEGQKLDEKLNAEEFSYLNVLEENNKVKNTNSFHILLATGNEEKTNEAKTKILLELKKYKNIKVICIEDCAYAELFYYCNSNMERLIKKDKVMDGYENIVDFSDIYNDIVIKNGHQFIKYEEYMYDAFIELQSLTNANIQISVDIAEGLVRKYIDHFNQNTVSYVEILEHISTEKKKSGAGYLYEYKKRPKVAASNTLVGVFSKYANKLLFYKESTGKLRIFDGDSICGFLAVCIKELLNEIVLNSDISNNISNNVLDNTSNNISNNDIKLNEISFGVFLSDMSSTVCMDYLKYKNIDFMLGSGSFRAMVENNNGYEIRLAWTPTGHGTVRFSKSAVMKLEKIVETYEQNNINSNNNINNSVTKQVKPAKILLTLYKLFGKYCTDAFGTLLVCKGTFNSHYDLNAFAQTYTRMINVRLSNEVFIERNIVVSPRTLQKDINHFIYVHGGRVVLKYKKLIDSVENSRSNIESSANLKNNLNGSCYGNLMVFAEAGSEENCDILALKVAELFYETCNGVGEYPSISYSTYDS